MSYLVIVSVRGGLVQDVDIPPGAPITVEVRDYDVDHTSPAHIKTDECGPHVTEEWAAGSI